MSSDSKNVIPILDCSEIVGELQDIQNSKAFKDFAKKLGDGMRNQGFVYLINYEEHLQPVKNLLTKSRDFFTLPKDVKLKYRKVDAVETFHGFTPAEDEKLGEIETRQKRPLTADSKECFDFWGENAQTESGFPTEVSGMKNAVDDWRSSLNEIAIKLLRAFGVYLELEDADYFIKQHRGVKDYSIQSHNLIRTNFYFPQEESAQILEEQDIFRLGEHCDWGTLTFLIQDQVGGLEAKMPSGDWIPITPIKDSIVLNAGLMLEMWSGGNLPATAHRVRLLTSSCSKYRQSVGYFIQPDGTSRCMPVVEEKAGWDPIYPYEVDETHYEYFKKRILHSRANY